MSLPIRNFALGLGCVTLLAIGCGRFSRANDAELELQRARQAADAGDVRVAASLYEKALRQLPDNPRPHLELGLLYDEKLGDPIAALYHYRRCVELETNADRRQVVEGYAARARLTLAAKLPGATTDPTELIRLQTEKAALMQELAALRTRVVELERASGSGADAVAVPAPPVAVTQPVIVATAPPPPATGSRTHVVQKGDTLQSLALRYYGNRTGWERIYAANRANLASKDQLKVGQLLVIP